jgi:thymidine kinase
LGRIEKGEKCSVCGKVAERSLSADKVKAAGLNVGGAEKRAYLCKEHYKEYKKKTKKDKTLDKWRYG